MKKISLFLKISLLALLLAGISQECMAGVVIEEVHRDQEGRVSKVLRYFSENRFRTDDSEAGLRVIIDFKNDRMVMIDHHSKSFVEIKFSQWEREVAERLKREFPGIQPKSRIINVRRTGETATINGFQTEKIEIWADRELIEENWVTRDVEMKDVESIMGKVAQGFSKQFRFEMKEGREIYEKLKPYGFPILIKDYTITYGLGGIDVSEVKKIEKKELEDEVFLPPGDYRKITPTPPKK
jgi:hypothetical protein